MCRLTETTQETSRSVNGTNAKFESRAGFSPYWKTAMGMFGPLQIRLNTPRSSSCDLYLHNNKSSSPGARNWQDNRNLPNGVSSICMSAWAPNVCWSGWGSNFVGALRSLIILHDSKFDLSIKILDFISPSCTSKCSCHDFTTKD